MGLGSMTKATIADSLALIFAGIEKLRETFPHRAFTIDGRLVGDIGEIIAEIDYDLVLDDVQRPGHDAVTRDGREVQIKATFKDTLTFKTVPDLYLGFRLYRDGSYEEVYNGPGARIHERFSTRSGIGEKLLSFPVAELQLLNRLVAASDRVAKRAE